VTHNVRSIDVHITEMHDLQRCLPRRYERLGICRGGLGERHLEGIHCWLLAQAEQGIAEFRGGLSEGADLTQIMRDDRSLLGQ
jgi:hypothetical protein